MKFTKPGIVCCGATTIAHGAPLRHIVLGANRWPTLGGKTEEATMNALAQLDNAYRAAGDGSMETTIATTSRIGGREVQFRCLVGLMVASLLGIAGLFFKVSGL